MGNICYECTIQQVRRVAFEYTASLTNNFDKCNRMAKGDWFEGFLARNDISPRRPEATSTNKHTAFIKTEVTLFCTLLVHQMENYRFVPQTKLWRDRDLNGTSPRENTSHKRAEESGIYTQLEKRQKYYCTVSASSFIPSHVYFPQGNNIHHNSENMVYQKQFIGSIISLYIVIK